MTVQATTLVQAKQMEATNTTQYTASGLIAIIDKATVTNNDSVNRTFSVYLVNPSGSAGASNLVLASRLVRPGETYMCPELIGQVLLPGASIVTTASAASALTLRVSGREIA